MFALALAALLSQATPSSPDARARWEAERAVPSARAEIEACLTSRGRDPWTCLRAPFSACERELGTSQRDLNACAVFSYRSWRERLDMARSRLAAAAARRQAGGDWPPGLAAGIDENDRRWRAWNEQDCEISARPSVGGTIHALEKYLCLSDHIALRAIELDRRAAWWDR